eukprot:NODE_357_length_10221_cov_0.563130.p5 type:complete len:206 gc:universal NODE_357_length_10221_cov_0.563130:2022-2639(+)
MQAIKQIRQLRPSVGLSHIKKILDMHGNDIDEALNYLDQNAIKFGKDLFASKLHSRQAKYKTISMTSNLKSFAVFSNCCETDFVANTKGFRDMSKDIGALLLNNKPYNDTLYKAMGEFKELIKIEKLVEKNLNDSEYLQSYQHDNQQLCVTITSSKVQDVLPKSIFAHSVEGNILGSDQSIKSYLESANIKLIYNKVFNMKEINK